MSSAKPLVAFFGATGGCANAALALALKDGCKAVALARTPKKLTDKLTSIHSIPSATLESNLTIIQGSSKELSSVKEVLSHNAQLVISGLGGAPQLRFSLFNPVTADDPKICGDSAGILLTALRELASEGKLNTKPIVVVISTTGLSKRRDVPLLWLPLYHWVLQEAHVDKKVMEDSIAKATTETNSPIGGFVILRPTLLTNGEAKGKDKVRVGWERHPDAVPTEDAGPGPAIGYTVSRADVGRFIFESIITGDGEWTNRCATLTY